jgi:hypothetical protein
VTVADDMAGSGPAGINLGQEQENAAPAAGDRGAAQLVWLETRIRALYRAEAEEPLPEAMIALVRGLTGRDPG